MAEGLAAINAEARAVGMSYGQYMAMKAEQGGHVSVKQPADALPEGDGDRQCPVCGDVFYPKRKTQVCCSRACQDRRRAELNRVQNVNRYRKKHDLVMTPRPCIHCGTMFVPPHGAKSICSEGCYAARAADRSKRRRAEAKEAAKDEKL